MRVGWAVPLAALVLGCSLARPLVGQETQQPQRFRVHLMTMGPGHEVYERFSHNAIWISDLESGRELVYNFGTYNFEEPGFLGRFIQGRPRYILSVATLEGTLLEYSHRRRRVDAQELNLTTVQAAELAFLLSQNALEENRTYTYDYYFDNCSTRVRDLLDQVLGGSLRADTEFVPGEGTLRFHTQRMITNSPALYLGILTAMGPAADRPLDHWGEMFLPEKLQDRIKEQRVIGEDGAEIPLVAAELSLLSFADYSVESTPPDWSFRFFLLGIALAGLILLGARDGLVGMAGQWLGGLWALLNGLVGSAILYLSWFTDHVMTSGNHNALFLSPLAFALVIALWRRGLPSDKRTFRSARVITVFVILVVIGAVMAISPSIGGQVNREVAALCVPPTLAACWLLLRVSRRRAVVLIPGR